jgi:diaminopimelate epimerase
MSGVRFSKAVACGNDFLIIDTASFRADLHTFTKRICDRQNGVGADGVEWITAGGADHDVAARLINSDGSDAEVSGNGTRCVAAYWVRSHGGSSVRVLTGAGVKHCELVEKHAGESYTFETDMGTPTIKGQLLINEHTGLSIETGNPHFAVIVADWEFDWQRKGRQIQESKVFTAGTNVEFVRAVNEHCVEARFVERGAGPTRSSGTGSCAAAIAAIHAGRAKSPVTVDALGGSQTVQWQGNLRLTGDANVICEGEFFDPLAP